MPRVREFALALVKTAERVGVQNNNGGNMAEVERPCAQPGAVPTRQNEGLLPDLRAEWLVAVHSRRLMLQELLVNQASLRRVHCFRNTCNGIALGIQLAQWVRRNTGSALAKAVAGAE